MNNKYRNESEQVKLEVTDTEIGISEDEIPRIFDRFFRGYESRSAPGSDPGLSPESAFVRAHSGEIRTESSFDEGTGFTVILPYMTSGEQRPSLAQGY